MAVMVTRLKNMILEFKITMEAMSITLYIGKIREKLRKINKFIFRSKKRKKKIRLHINRKYVVLIIP